MQAIAEIEVYQAGELTVIGFGGREILDQLNLAECHHEIVELVRAHACHTLAVDLSGTHIIPSGLLGLLASIHRMGVDLHLFNPSQDARDAIVITNLDRILKMHEVEV